MVPTWCHQLGTSVITRFINSGTTMAPGAKLIRISWHNCSIIVGAKLSRCHAGTDLVPSWCQTWHQLIHLVPLQVPTWCHIMRPVHSLRDTSVAPRLVHRSGMHQVSRGSFSGRLQLTTSRCGKICPPRARRYRALPHKKPSRFYGAWSALSICHIVLFLSS